MIVYPLGISGQRLIFCPSVVAHFQKYRQLRWWQREAGGQLFPRFALPDITVEEATGPHRGDWRTRFTYQPNRRAEQQEIAERHRRGLHFVGDWHTHPEAVPTPSARDMQSMGELFARSEHALNGFVLLIVGTDPAPRGLSVSLFDGTYCVILPARRGALTEPEAPRTAKGLRRFI
ncbi:integrative and conjugative element protein, VC0181 family [Rhizobiales bacterium GAS188]|nr:integrative and conjugative element protein, VC0181 family [Rhizobiales bacterium GAS188]